MANVTAFVLGETQNDFISFIPDNLSQGGNVILINHAAIFAEIRDTEIIQCDCYGMLKVGAFVCSSPN